MAMHSTILSATQIEDMFLGEVPTTDLIGLWTFDESDPLKCDIGNGFSPSMNLSIGWVGEITVASEAPFDRVSTPPELSSIHLVLNDTETLVNLLPSWSETGDTVTVLSKTSGIEIFQVDDATCATSLFDSLPCSVTNSDGLSLFSFFFGFFLLVAVCSLVFCLFF